jgi:ParB/RepB/Spo0J family partition protein
MNAPVTGMRIALTAIRPNPSNPRGDDFDEAKLEELCASILAAGKVHQAIKVRPVPPEGEVTFEIVMGERRWRACNRLVSRGHQQFASIPATSEEMSRREMQIQAIVENLQRADVNPVNEAFAFRDLIDNEGMTDVEVGRLVGIDAFRVRERLALTNLDEQVLQLVRSGQLPPTSGVEISKLPKHRQGAVVREIARGKVTTIAEIRAAVDVIQQIDSQSDMLACEPVATAEEVARVNAMERKIESIKAMVAKGWKDGDCVVARKVSPDRVTKMAEELALIRLHVGRMETALRQAAVQAELLG